MAERAKSCKENEQSEAGAAVQGSGKRGKAAATGQKKLSYQESKELAGIEGRITEAEQEVQIRHQALEDPEVMGDHVRLQNVLAELVKAQEIADALYARWAELEQAQG